MAGKISKTVSALKAQDVKPLEPVDNKGNYYVSLQFGALRSWREYSGQSRKEVRKLDGTIDAVHRPKVYERIGPFDGRTVNGLISSHNGWVKDYLEKRDGKSAGFVDRQKLVLDVEVTDETPKGTATMVPVELLSQLINSAVRQQVKELVGDPK